MLESQLQLGGRRLNYACFPAAVASDRLPLVMVHGVTRRWQTFLPLYASLSQVRTVYGLDFRGHGDSAPLSGQYLVADYVDDAVALAEQIEGPVVLYGHSLGAMVVAAAAGRLGKKVPAVAMEDPPLDTMGTRIVETPLLSLFQAMHRVAQCKDQPVSTMAAMLADAELRDPHTGSSTRLGDVRDAASLRFSASCLKRLDPGVLEPIVAARWLEGYDTDEVFRQLRCPTLLLQADPGAAGMLTDDDAARVSSLAADMTRVRLAGCSHNVHWDRTTDLLNYVHAFLETID